MINIVEKNPKDEKTNVIYSGTVGILYSMFLVL